MKYTKVNKRNSRNCQDAKKVMVMGNITELGYYLIKFEFGCLFLEKILPEGEGNEMLYTYHSQNPNYWTWWNLNFTTFVNDFLKFENSDEFDPVFIDDFKKSLFRFIALSETENSFSNNYLKMNLSRN